MGITVALSLLAAFVLYAAVVDPIEQPARKDERDAQDEDWLDHQW